LADGIISFTSIVLFFNHNYKLLLQQTQSTVCGLLKTTMKRPLTQM